MTGASGFLGRHVASDLAADGNSVRGLFRSPPPYDAPGVVPVYASGLLARKALAQALRGVDTVIHLAARVHVMEEEAGKPLAEFRRVNVEGTRALMEEATRAGVRCFVFASSVKAIGESNDAPWTETTPPAPSSPYGISKLEAELVVQELANQDGLRASVLRLPLVYGPGMKANMLRLFDLVHRGIPLPLGSIANQRSIAYVGNVVAAVRAVLRLPSSTSETFLVADPESVSTSDLVREIAHALNRPARLIPLPQRLLRAAATASERLLPPGMSPVTTAAVDRLLGSLQVDASKLARLTGSLPPFSTRVGLERTAAWYRSVRALRTT